jgi:enoyl-CoA hydratase
VSEYPFTYINYEVDREANIATVTLTNPHAGGNASPFFAEEQLLEAIDAWESDDDVKVVIIKGAGHHFCAGHDVGGYLEGFQFQSKANAPKPRLGNHKQLVIQRDLRDAWRRLFYSLKPTIAQVEGQCIEWGNAIQVCCDMTIAADDAHFGNLGQVAGISGITILRVYVSLIGQKRTREMMISGRTFSGADASAIGLINHAVPASELEDTVRREAARIALLPLDGIVTGKAYTNLVFDSMGFTSAFTETYFGHELGLKMKFEPDDFWFFDEIRRNGIKDAVQKRKDRYEPVGGFGADAEYPLWPEKK